MKTDPVNIQLSSYQKLFRTVHLLACMLCVFSAIKSTEKPGSSQPQPIQFPILDHLNKILPLPTEVNRIIAEYTPETRCSFLPVRGQIFGSSVSNKRDFRHVYLITVDPHNSLPVVYSAMLSDSKGSLFDVYFQASWCALPDTWNREEIATFICSASEKKGFWQQEYEMWVFNQHPPIFKNLDSFELAVWNKPCGSASIMHSTKTLFLELGQLHATLRPNTDPRVAKIARKSPFVLVDITQQQFFQAWKNLGRYLQGINKTTPKHLDDQLSEILKHYAAQSETIEAYRVATEKDQTVIFTPEEQTK